MNDYTHFHVEPMTAFVGAEVHGIDLSRTLSDAVLEDLRRAWHTHGVVFFRDQTLSHEQHIALGRQLGEPYTMPSVGVNHPEHPELFHLYADEHSSYVAGEGWHADGTGEAAPPLGGLMAIEELPPIGGDTLFVSVHEAYRRLSLAMQSFLRSLKAEHSAAKAWGRVDYATPTGGFPLALHPVVIRHPVTGREALYVNGGFTTRIVDLAPAESDALLAFLFRHLETPDFACRFRWRSGSVALWDNRAVQHCALFNYQPHRRSGWRYTIQGPRPEPA